MEHRRATMTEEEINRQIIRLTTRNHEITLLNEQLKLDNQTMQDQRERLADLNLEHHELANRNRELTLQNEQLKRIPLVEQRMKALLDQLENNCNQSQS